MKIIPENEDDIVAIITHEFPSFGGGTVRSANNPISHALQDKPPMFAAGVDITAVVKRVRELSAVITQLG
jgi:hypothetical protein